MHEAATGKWDRWYSFLDVDEGPHPYGLSDSYKIGADWLAGCSTVEDWGCGKGWLRTLVEPERYRGLDGSHTPFADEIVDLATYRSEVPGIFIRHVLEHDYRWRTILDNAAASFTERLALIFFTPMASDKVIELAWNEDPGVPDLSIPHIDVLQALGMSLHDCTSIVSSSQYGSETIYLAERQ